MSQQKYFKYLTHAQTRTHLKNIKRNHSHATVLGLDVGRKYTGVSISDRSITRARPLQTLQGDPNYVDEYKRTPEHLRRGKKLGTVNLNDSNGVFAELRRIISKRAVKAIVVGYPLNHEG